MSFDHLLADRTRNMGANAIREILKVVSQPGMISLAGGIPAPQSFPLPIIRELAAQIFDKHGTVALQYGVTEGFQPLREQLVEYVKLQNIHTNPDEIVVTSGSQSMLDALGKVLITKGDKIAVEAPTYVGAISAFNPYEPQYLALPTDDDGVIPEALEEMLKQHKLKFVYVIPTFQNPTGRTLSLERRKEIARIIQQYNVLLLEDDPYGALRFKGDPVPPIKALAPEHVVYLGTLSKVFAPGLRVGFGVAPESIRKWVVLAKQGIDLHTSSFSQALAAEYLAGGHLQAHLPKIIELYRPRMEAMLESLDTHFPQEFTWTRPEGGMFFWAAGPKGMDLDPIYWKAIENKVAFVPGKYFFTDSSEGLETMRLNFTMSNEETIRMAVERLAGVIKSFL